MIIIFKFNGREAIPVRAIPFITGWYVSPDMIAESLAHTDPVTKLTGIAAYHLAGNDEPAPMLPKEWDGVEAEIQALSDRLKANVVVDSESYLTWRHESILLLPAGVFIWKDEFNTAFVSAYSDERMNILKERPGDRELNLTPLIPQALREAVVEGFSDDEIQRHGQLHAAYQELLAKYALLEGKAEKEKPLSLRKESAYLNTIAVLLELIQSPVMGRDSAAAVISEMLRNYSDTYGISKTQLEKTFAAANRNLMAN